MSLRALDKLKERFGDAVVSTHSDRGDDTAVVNKDVIVDVMRFLREDAELAFDMPVDVTAVDHVEREPRFEVVYHLYSTTKKKRVRVKAAVNEDDPVIASIVGVYSGANFFEREAFDMYGIRFSGHPDLRRIFMYDEFVGHPLRKDYPKEKRQPLFRREGMS